MKVTALFGLGAFLIACGGGSPATIPAADACNQITATACQKIFEATCTDAASAAVQSGLKSEAQCEALVVEGYCATSESLCPAGYTYHGDKAQLCKDAISNQKCASLNMTLAVAFITSGGDTTSAIATLKATFPDCAVVCTAPGG
ncbi:MAG TPA: hypothetical protein VHU40_09685 [Polyangia bacterium]|jgi:hypothetical protein|nr:hypothetical protein [Polyangia bacterium]